MNSLQTLHVRSVRSVIVAVSSITVAALLIVFLSFQNLRAQQSQMNQVTNYHLATLNLTRSLHDELALPRRNLARYLRKPELQGAAAYAINRDISFIADLQEQYADARFTRTVSRIEKRAKSLLPQQPPEQLHSENLRRRLDSLNVAVDQLERMHLLAVDAMVDEQNARERRSLFSLLTLVGVMVLIAIGLLVLITRSLRQSRDEQSHNEQRLQDLRNRLGQSERLNSLGMLVGGVAHDFNNMLTVVIGRASTLREQVGDSHQADVDDILAAGEQAARLTSQLLTFAKQEPGEPIIVNINAQIRKSLPILKNLVSEDVDLQFNLGEQLPCVVIDPIKLDQLLLNLVSNARDATASNGCIVISTSSMTVNQENAVELSIKAGTYCQLVVRDDGAGMDEEVLAHIFDPFFSGKGRQRGTGLGLSIVHGIVSAAQGVITVQSEPGKGANFEILLPTATDNSVQDPSTTVPRNGGNETLLILEDDAAIRTMLNRHLSMLGYRVLVGEDGLAGVEIASKHPDEVDLILSDVVMPALNGPEAVASIRSSQPNAVVVYMSGYTDSLLSEAGLSLEDTTLIRKPFRLAELAGKVRQLLDSNAGSAPLG